MSNNKVKGLLKGLRYISQIFDNEKEPEMQIGLPTDVKHVAHIGWDGPSVNSAPSWMNEFKAPPGEVVASNSPARDLPDLPRASRRSSTGASAESPTREKADKPRSSRRASKNSSAKELSGSDSSKPTRMPLDSSLGSESPSRNLPNIPKKTRRKKSKDSSVGGSTRSSRLKGQATETDSDLGSESGSVSRLNNGEHCQSSNLKPFEEGEEKGVIGIA